MMRHGLSLGVPLVAGTQGSSVQVARFDRKAFHLWGTFTATYQLQISTDPANPPDATSWANEGAAIAGAGATSQIVEVTKPCCWARWACTAYTSGVPQTRGSAVIAEGA